MTHSQPAPGIVGPFAGLDVPWLLRMRAESRRDHPFLIWAPFEGPARNWSYGEFHERVGALSGGACEARHQARRICPDPSRQLHRGDAGLVCLRRTRCHRGDHQHPLGAGRNGIFRRSLRRGGRDHPAGLRRVGVGQCRGLRWTAVSRTTQARRRRRLTPARRQLRRAVRRQRRPAAPRHRSISAVQRAIHLRHDVAPEGGAVDRTPTRCGAPRSMPRTKTSTTPTCTRPIPLPMFHTNALAYSMLATLWVGDTRVIQPRFSASRFWSVALEHDCTWTSTIPFCMKALLEYEIPKNTSSGCGAPRSTTRNPSPPSASRRSAAGMTETITHGIVGEVDQPNTPMSIGRAAAEMQIRITEDDGTPTGVGGTGNLLINGHVAACQLFAEYLQQREGDAPRAYARDGYFITGDRVTAA